MRKVLRALGSLRLTVGLLVAVGALMLAALAIPQKAVLQRDLYLAWRGAHPVLVPALEAVGLTDVHRSWLAVALWTAFFVNLAAVMARRIPAAIERARVSGPIPDPALAPGFSHRRRIPVHGPDPLRRARAALERRGVTLQDGEGRLRAVRNRLAPLFTLGFHLSFFLLLAGGIVSAYTRFEGLVELAQGQSFDGERALYVEPTVSARFAEIPRTTFVVESIRPESVGGTAVGVEVTVRDAALRAHVLEINRPYRAGGSEFVFRDLGVAPLLVVQRADGEELDGAWVRLALAGDAPDRFQLLGRPFEARFFADHVEDADGERSRSRVVRNPVLRLSMRTDRGTSVSAALRPGESMALGPYRLTFADWRYWVRLYVRSERGVALVFAGFAIAAAALAARLLLYRREFLVGLDAPPGGEAALVVAGRSEYYRALFSDEFDRVVAEVAASADGSGPGAG